MATKQNAIYPHGQDADGDCLRCGLPESNPVTHECPAGLQPPTPPAQEHTAGAPDEGVDEWARRVAVYAFSLDGYDSLDEDGQQTCRDLAEWARRRASEAVEAQAREIEGLRADAAARDDDLAWAWAVIANASQGDWTKEHPDWQDAAARWRDKVMSPLSRRQVDAARQEPRHG